MQTRTSHTKSRRWRALALCSVCAMVAMAPMPVTSAGMARSSNLSLTGVDFSSDCVTATVESTRPVTSIVVVFNNDEWEQMDGIAGIASYVVKVGPRATESGLAIATLYVDADSRLRNDPLGIVPHKVGTGFECKQRPASNAKRRSGRPAVSTRSVRVG